MKLLVTHSHVKLKLIQPDNIIIDFAKAFDKVPTNIYSTKAALDGMVSKGGYTI